jgi:peptidyl-prolyl cis-trans isomerase D
MSQLVEMELVRQETDKQRLWTTDAEVRDYIMGIPQFNEDGRFKPELYKNYLAAVRKSPAEFEDEIRRERSLRRSVEMFRAALQPLPIETERQKELGAMKAEVEFVRIPAESLVIPESIPQAEVQAYVAKPENEAKLKAAYEARKQEFSTDETVRARHILVSGDDKKAEEKIKMIASKLKTEDFAKLAGQYSEDPGSKNKGGDLGSFTKDKMVEEFSKVAFSLPVGQVSEPVKTQYGYHLIKVESKKPAQTRTYEEARDDLASQEIARERSRAAVEQLEAAMRQGDAGAVTKFIEANKLKWETSGPFSIEAESIPKMNAGDDAIRTAFALNAQKPMADRLVRQGPVAFIMRHKGVQAAKDDAKDPQAGLLSEFTANRRSEDALRLWLESLKKGARISYNGSTGGPSNQ